MLRAAGHARRSAMIARRLIFPALLSALLAPASILLALGIPLGNPQLSGLITSTLLWSPFTFGGILAFGLPAARHLARRGTNLPAAILVLLLDGAVGGWIIGMLFSALVSGTFSGIVTVGLFGAVPGAMTALIWLAFNADMFHPAGLRPE